MTSTYVYFIINVFVEIELCNMYRPVNTDTDNVIVYNEDTENNIP